LLRSKIKAIRRVLKRSPEVHVCHGVLADSDVSADSGSSEVGVLLDHVLEVLLGMSELGMGVSVVLLSMVSVSGMNLSNVSGVFPVVVRLHELSSEVHFHFMGMACLTVPDTLDVVSVFVSFMSDVRFLHPVDSVLFDLVSVVNSLVVHEDSSLHLVVTGFHDFNGMVISASPDGCDMRGTFVCGKFSSASVDATAVVMTNGSDHTAPVSVQVSVVDQNFVGMVAFVSRGVGSLDMGDHFVVSGFV